ncbi:unnamed protein product [Pseudo-nitzschia multistriata]|uniref:Uncharacterized protein n=1 Tax=Pseudo-nitzschia multistriata TaxID=183589 RepID=A0A448Z8X3_9STRA|nr:unnamed protein product [Pseudo-nitzschia multistriata]
MAPRQITSTILLASFLGLSSTTQAFTAAPAPGFRAATSLAAANNEPTPSVSRRRLLERAGAFAAAAVFAPVTAASALDMEAFANSQIEADIKNCDPKRDPKCIPKLNADEALCKYGQSGSARGEACKRVKAAGGDISQKPQGKALGGAYAM